MLPVFLYVLFARDNRAGAAWLLGAISYTDWIDGWVARKLNQTSVFGSVFDPFVDRMLFIVATLGVMIDGGVPSWFCIAILIREITVGGAMWWQPCSVCNDLRSVIGASGTRCS